MRPVDPCVPKGHRGRPPQLVASGGCPSTPRLPDPNGGFRARVHREATAVEPTSGRKHARRRRTQSVRPHEVPSHRRAPLSIRLRTAHTTSSHARTGRRCGRRCSAWRAGSSVRLESRSGSHYGSAPSRTAGAATCAVLIGGYRCENPASRDADVGRACEAHPATLVPRVPGAWVPSGSCRPTIRHVDERGPPYVRGPARNRVLLFGRNELSAAA